MNQDAAPTPTRRRQARTGSGLVLLCSLALNSCNSPVPTGAPSPPTGSAAATLSSSRTPSDVDLAAATSVMTTYLMHVSKGEYDRAWSLLAPATQLAQGSLAQFAAERAAYMKSAGGIYRLGLATHDRRLLDQWVSAADPASPPLARAFLAQVDYPRLANNPAGFEILVAAPDPAGDWLVWVVR
jgi:hypothetical protein